MLNLHLVQDCVQIKCRTAGHGRRCGASARMPAVIGLRAATGPNEGNRMQYTTLGRTGLKVSVAGLGAGGNSRLGQGRGLSTDSSVALVREAFDLGVNFIDTAEAYGTEEIVG